MSFSKLTTRKRGFTLIELLIVIVVIAILALIVIPRVMNASRKAREASLVANLHMLRNAVESFHTDTGYFPKALTTLTQGTAVAADFIKAGGGSPTQPPTSFHGPYLTAQGGVEQLPTNPFANAAATTADKHWAYTNTTGTVACPADDANVDYPDTQTLDLKDWTAL